MRALRVSPGVPGSEILELDFPMPRRGHKQVLVKTLLLGLCGSDRDITLRPTPEPLITVGHESLGEVVAAPADSDLNIGDRVVGIIRRPCEDICAACAIGRCDICRSDDLMERGLFTLDGFGSDYWVSEAEFLVRVPASLGDEAVLLEPLSSIVKLARRLMALRVDLPNPRSGALLIAGAGPIGMLAAWHLSARFNRIFLVDPKPVVDRWPVANAGARIEVLREWRFAPTDVSCFIDCSGDADAESEGICRTVPGGIVGVLGIPSVSAGPPLGKAMRTMVFRDINLVASVNASRSDHEEAGASLTNLPDELKRLLLANFITPNEWPLWMSGSLNRALKTIVRFS